MARYDLHLSDAEYENITLQEFNALCQRRQQEIEHHDFMLAQLCCLMANLWSDKHDFKPEDFMPRKAESSKEQTPEEMLAVIQYVDAAMQGKRIKNNGE